MLSYEEEEKEIKELASLFERNSFADVKKHLQALKASDKYKHGRFYEYLASGFLWIEISKRKISLADFVSKKCGAVAFPEDRTRIVLSLAKLNGKNLDFINKALEKEFGDYFKLLPEYSVPGKKISFSDVTKRAAKIRNGLFNICYLSVEAIAREIMIYFRSNTINNKEELIRIREMSFNLLAKMRNPLSFMSPETYNQIKPELIAYYKATNRAQLDISSLEDNPDFDEIAKFIYITTEIVSTKLRLMEKNYAPTDIARAQTIISSNLADADFRGRISVEEIRRTGMPLPKNNKTVRR